MTSLLSNLSASPQALESAPVSERVFTGPRGREFSVESDPLLLATFHGVTAARVILFDPENPSHVALRQGKNGRFGPVGGALRPFENPVQCAVREGREESELPHIPNLTFVTVLVHEGKGTWLDRRVWDSWGYSVQGRTTKNDSVLVANIRTAIFAAPIAGDFEPRKVEGRTVRLFDLQNGQNLEAIRPMFRHLLTTWKSRLESPGEIPSQIRYTRS